MANGIFHNHAYAKNNHEQILLYDIFLVQYQVFLGAFLHFFDTENHERKDIFALSLQVMYFCFECETYYSFALRECDYQS